MMYSQLPSWRYLAGFAKHTDEPFWDSGSYIFTHSSAASLQLIFTAYKKLSEKKDIHVYIPAYFCEETLNKVRGPGIRICFYETDGDLEPDWKKLREQKDLTVDIFLFCHYFGVFHDVSRARNFCDQKKAVLIEDCAHVLYPAGSYGRKGDFVLYSPHKVIPVPDGGIIARNKSRLDIVTQITEMITKECSTADQNACILWRMKKAVQKVTGIQSEVPYTDGAHYGTAENHYPEQMHISEYSLRAVRGLTKKQLKQMAYIRRCNLKTMDRLVHEMEPDAESLLKSSDECPYFAAYRIHSARKRKQLVNMLKKRGIGVLYWPDLPQELKDTDGYIPEKELSEKLIAVPVHQGIRPRNIAGKISRTTAEQQEFSLRYIQDTKEARQEWEHVMKRVRMGNIPQDWSYGNAKKRVEKWGLKRAIIYNRQKEAVGVLQMLQKTRAGITAAVRINRGPLLVSGYDTAENKLQVMELVRRDIRHPVPVIYAPDIEFSGENLARMTQHGWIQWNVFGFPSGLLDLSQKEETIRKNLDGKWRNQLKAAEKKGLVLRTDQGRFEEMLDLYEENQKEKGYTGVPGDILRDLMYQKKTPLRLMYVENENRELTAFDIFYTASNFGLYFVGWNSAEGRKQYANHYLLYQAAVFFKKEGMRWLDLGGIDHIETEENAVFKDGMRPVHYQLLGEFIRF